MISNIITCIITCEELQPGCHGDNGSVPTEVSNMELESLEDEGSHIYAYVELREPMEEGEDFTEEESVAFSSDVNISDATSSQSSESI